jgi:4-carboxymuconolactone decarboxylase
MDTTPRLEPIPDDAWTERQREVMAPLLNNKARFVYTTLLHNPDLAEKMTTLGRELRSDGGLTLRERETLILRTGWNCRSEYEYAQHRELALGGGMTEADLARIVAGPDAQGWDPVERTLCVLADELHRDGEVTDATWAALDAAYDAARLVQAVMIVGYYHSVAYLLAAFRTPLEPGKVGFPT